jgi:drug/metabolite transporter superfamily protein YnfA
VTAIIWEAKVDRVTITVRDSAGNTVGVASASLEKERSKRRRKDS